MFSKFGFIACLLITATYFASDIHEFDLNTKERVGNALAQASRRADRGASDMVRKRARETAIAALRAKTSGMRYEYLVVNNPIGKGLLVYAEPTWNQGTIIGGDIRATVSADSLKVERVEELSKWVLKNKRPPGATLGVIGMADPEGNVPSETYIYRSALYGAPICVGMRDKTVWMIADGGIRKLS
jgi:hypothetical protein